ncbi:MAG: DUF2270 domain-containing protein [Acidobacteriota bacterium]
MGDQEHQAPVAALSRGSGEPEGFHQAMVHLYRGEMQRMTVWRSRLDTTSNWAILLSTGMTTFALGSPNIPHFVLLLGLALIGICIIIEARRYRHLLHTRWRLRMLEAHYFAGQLRPSSPEEKAAWKEELAEDLDRPCFTTGTFMALRLRLRRNYLLLVYFVSAVWLTKVFVHPEGVADVQEFYSRFGVGELLPSWFVAMTAGLFVLAATVLAVITPSEEKMDQIATRERRGCQ